MKSNALGRNMAQARISGIGMSKKAGLSGAIKTAENVKASPNQYTPNRSQRRFNLKNKKETA
jgi:hypothetical protein